MGDFDKKFLNQIGVNVDSNLLYLTMINKSCTDFFLWLQENISDNNILSFGEINDHHILKTRGELLSKEQIEEIFRKTESEYHGLFEDLEYETEYFEKQLTSSKFIHREFEDLLQKYEGIQEQSILQYKESVSRKELAQVELQQSVSRCVAACEHLDDQEGKNYLKSKHFVTLHSKQLTMSGYLYQMPLNQFWLSNGSLKLGIEEFFETDPLLQFKHDAKATLDKNIHTLSMAKRDLFLKEQDKLDADLDLITLKSIEKLNNFEFPQSERQLLIALNSIQNEKDLTESKYEHLYEEVIENLEKVLQLNMEELLEGHVQDKHRRATLRHQVLSRIQAISEVIVKTAVLLTSLKASEAQNIKSAVEAQQTRDKIIKRRLKLMNNIKLFFEKNGKNSMLVFTEKLKSRAREMSPADSLSKINEILVDFENQIERTAQEFGINFEVPKVLRRSIYGKQLSRPKIMNSAIQLKFQGVEMWIQSIEKSYKDLQEEYIKKYNDPRSKNRFLKLSSRLWIWFLTQPKNVIQALNQVKEASTNKSSINMVISGIKRN